LNVIFHTRAGHIRPRRAKDGQPLVKWRGALGSAGGPAGKSSARVSASSVFVNWAALVALWALPYLTLLDHFRPDAARSEILQWSLLIVGALGLVSLLYSVWRETLDPAWRAKHGFAPRKRRRPPHTENVA